jgi:hypothetical protein
VLLALLAMHYSIALASSCQHSQNVRIVNYYRAVFRPGVVPVVRKIVDSLHLTH